MFREILPEYGVASGKPGLIEELEYDTAIEKKKAYVYTPYGYDHSRKYEILYLMHGGGGSQGDYMGDGKHVTRFRKAIDHLIEKGEMEPVIMVFPTYYYSMHDKKSKEDSYAAVLEFIKEVDTYLMPKVESAYSTYAETTDEAGFTASRDHRAFGGFSLGSVTTWYMFTEKLRYFSKFIPMSGDSWILTVKGGREKPVETADALAEVVEKQGYTGKDFRIYSATGSEDKAARGLVPMFEAMKKHPEVFDFGAGGNIFFNVVEGGKHEMKYVKKYLFNLLPMIYS